MIAGSGLSSEVVNYKPHFIEPMECLAVAKLPEGPNWVYEIKLDGHRAEAIRTSAGVEFYSRDGKSFNKNSLTLLKC